MISIKKYIKSDKHQPPDKYIGSNPYVKKDFIEIDEDAASYYQRPFNFKEGDKVYIGKYCSVPRSKIKNVFIDKGLKITHDYTKADHIIFSSNFVQHYCDKVYAWNYLLTKDQTKELVQAIKNKISTGPLDPFYDSYIKPFVDTFSKDDIDDYDAFIPEYQLRNHISMLLGSQDLEENWKHIETYRFYKHNEETRDFLTFITNNKDKLVCEQSLLGLINDSIVMNKELYISLDKMLSSGSDDNVAIAMETMANCKYDESAIWLLLLLNKYADTIKYHKNAKHVNFRSFLSYFGFNHGLYKEYIRFNTIIEILNERNLLTEENISIITNELREKDDFVHHRCKYFKYRDLYFDPESLKTQEE